MVYRNDEHGSPQFGYRNDRECEVPEGGKGLPAVMWVLAALAVVLFIAVIVVWTSSDRSGGGQTISEGEREREDNLDTFVEDARIFGFEWSKAEAAQYAYEVCDALDERPDKGGFYGSVQDSLDGDFSEENIVSHKIMHSRSIILFCIQHQDAIPDGY